MHIFDANAISPQEYNRDANARPVPSSSVRAWGIVGARGKTCADCVLAGEHIQHYDKLPTAYCKLNAYLFFAVHEVLVSTIDKTGNPNNVTRKGVWTAITDLKDEFGEPVYTESLIVAISLTSSVISQSLHNSKSDKKLTVGFCKKDELPSNPSEITCPEDCDTLRPFLMNLMSPKSIDAASGIPYFLPDRDIEGTDIAPIYLPVVEMFQPTRTDGGDGVKNVPVFRVSPDYDAQTSFGLLQQAASVYSNELEKWKAANNYIEPTSLPISYAGASSSNNNNDLEGGAGAGVPNGNGNSNGNGNPNGNSVVTIPAIYQ
jgi:hypothetical protein